ncbi:MAG: YbaB/EbfC family nucleoid-associated protein [Phycisphaerales bacterium]|nr:YbaB/EbfC family nucleoid-associated protein [Phycisphaerales bacterium]
MFKGLKNLGAMASLMKDLPAMQARMEEVRASLGEIRVVGTAGAGAVKVHMSGDMVVQETQVDAAALAGQDIEALITMAVNDAIASAQEASRSRIAEAAAEMGLPMPENGQLPGMGI